MNTTNAFCPGCGSPRSPGAKFCRKCRMKFDEKSTAEQTIDTLQAVSKTAGSVKSTISTAESAIQTASQVKDFVITPPAQWKVVIGDRLPGIGQAVATAATQKVQEKIETVVKEKVGEIVEETIKKTPAQGAGTWAATIPTAGSSVCTSCGKQVKAGAKFCGSCGAEQKIIQICPRCGAPMALGFCEMCGKATVVNENPPSRICPHCGLPIRENAKFCGSCGKKVV